MKPPDDEARELRRCLRDVVALTMLPSVWTGYDAAQICTDLADVVFRTVDADAVLLTAVTSATVDVLRLREEGRDEIARLIREAAARPIASDSSVLAGTSELRLLSYPLTAGSEDRLIVASARADFPNEAERLLVRVAANQAAMWIERKRAEHASRFLAEAGDLLGRSLDYEKTLHTISTLAVPRLGDWCFVDLMQPDGGFDRIAVAHANPAAAPLARRLRRTYAPNNAPYGVSHAFGKGKTVLMNDVTPDMLTSFARDDDHREALLSMGIRAWLSVPMTSRGKTLGVITFLATESRTRFAAADIALAEELTRRAALAVDNARLYQEAQDANRAKDEFLANLSHELRTPMTAIIGWTHLLQLGALAEDDALLGLETIRQSAKAQAALIDELLDVSRIITGKLHITPSVVTVSDIVRAAVAAIRPAADARRQEVEFDEAAENLHVFGDAARLQQVFWNLLSNAVKFTPTGGSIRVAVTHRDADSVIVSVTDTGEGIAPEFLPLIFERFRQVTSQAPRRGGLGLGLAIARELVELHGGTLTVESAGAGRGSTFTVTLPLHLEEQEAPGREAAPRARRQRLDAMRVLLVEDDEMTRTLIDTLLRSFGAEVMASSSAAGARDALASFRPDILVSDIAMPGEDGVTLLHSLRLHDQRAFPAIAVTAFADDTSRERVLAAGFDGFVAKPLDPITLADEIERAVSEYEARRA